MSISLGIKAKISGFWNERKAQWLQIRAEERCLIGANSIVHNPDLIVSQDRNKSKIRIGSNTHIEGELIAYQGGEIRIGDFCYISKNTRIWSFESVQIGNRVLIAHNVNIFDSQTHSFNAVHRHQEFLHVLYKGGPPQDMDIGKDPVSIEDDVWIACGAIILQGVSIGRGAIVGAGSVVTKDVPAWTLVAGNPARVIRELKAEESRISVPEEVLSGLNHD